MVKYKKELVKVFILAIGLLFLHVDMHAQKSGKKPNFTNWSRGKDFKYMTRKSKNLGLDKGPKYLFVSEATQPTYSREGGKESGYRATEVVEEAADNARASLAQLLNTTVERTAEKRLTQDGDGRSDYKKTIQTVSAQARFSGFVQVGSYYQKETNDGYQDYHAWVLFSYKEEELRKLLEAYSKELGIPNFTEDILSEIQTATDNLDDVDDKEFGL